MTSWMRYLLVGIVLAAPAASRGQAPRAPLGPWPLPAVGWGDHPDSVRAHAIRSAWTFLEVDGDGDHVFRGNIAGYPALAFASFGDSGLVRLTVSVDPHPAVASTFERLRDSVRSRHGRPVLSSDEEGPWRPAPSLFVASAWQGVLMGLRRDGRILVVLTCPAASPRLPVASAVRAA